MTRLLWTAASLVISNAVLLAQLRSSAAVFISYTDLSGDHRGGILRLDTTRSSASNDNGALPSSTTITRHFLRGRGDILDRGLKPIGKAATASPINDDEEIEGLPPADEEIDEIVKDIIAHEEDGGNGDDAVTDDDTGTGPGTGDDNAANDDLVDEVLEEILELEEDEELEAELSNGSGGDQDDGTFIEEVKQDMQEVENLLEENAGALLQPPSTFTTGSTTTNTTKGKKDKIEVGTDKMEFVKDNGTTNDDMTRNKRDSKSSTNTASTTASTTSTSPTATNPKKKKKKKKHHDDQDEKLLIDLITGIENSKEGTPSTKQASTAKTKQNVGGNNHKTLPPVAGKEGKDILDNHSIYNNNNNTSSAFDESKLTFPTQPQSTVKPYIPEPDDDETLASLGKEGEAFDKSTNSSTPTSLASSISSIESSFAQVDPAKQMKILFSILSIFFIMMMIVTAHQMSDNPDGLCASFCRLSIAVVACVLRSVMIPCRLTCCPGRGGRGPKHSQISTEYREEDPPTYRGRRGEMELT